MGEGGWGGKVERCSWEEGEILLKALRLQEKSCGGKKKGGKETTRASPRRKKKLRSVPSVPLLQHFLPFLLCSVLVEGGKINFFLCFRPSEEEDFLPPFSFFFLHRRDGRGGSEMGVKLSRTPLSLSPPLARKSFSHKKVGQKKFPFFSSSDMHAGEAPPVGDLLLG